MLELLLAAFNRARPVIHRSVRRIDQSLLRRSRVILGEQNFFRDLRELRISVVTVAVGKRQL